MGSDAELANQVTGSPQRARIRRGSAARPVQQEAQTVSGPLPNNRLKLAGARKWRRLPLVHQMSPDSKLNAGCARGVCARSLSAVR